MHLITFQDPFEAIKTCTLMATDECTLLEMCSEPCLTGDIGCKEGMPEDKSCKGPIQFDPLSIHWGCIPHGQGAIPNPYDPVNGVNMPAETICFSTQR